MSGAWKIFMEGQTGSVGRIETLDVNCLARGQGTDREAKILDVLSPATII